VHWVVVGDALREPFLTQVLMGGLLGGLYAAVVWILVMALTGLGPADRLDARAIARVLIGPGGCTNGAPSAARILAVRTWL